MNVGENPHILVFVVLAAAERRRPRPKQLHSFDTSR